jgi:hypothetical protein
MPDDKKLKLEFPFQGLREGNPYQKYPRYLYREGAPPFLVENTDEEEKARADGYDSITASALANKQLVNWYWDLEDMSAKQLVVFARDEFGIELPVEAGQTRLFKAVCELSKFAPQNRDRLVLMAHTIQMNYAATLEEIKRMVAGKGQDLDVSEVTVREFYA